MVFLALQSEGLWDVSDAEPGREEGKGTALAIDRQQRLRYLFG
jgi:hypothetical protein